MMSLTISSHSDHITTHTCVEFLNEHGFAKAHIYAIKRCVCLCVCALYKQCEKFMSHVAPSSTQNENKIGVYIGEPEIELFL